MTELYPEAPFEDVDPDAPPIPDMSIRSDDEKTIAAEVGFSFITAVLMGKALGIWPKLGERFSSGYDHQTLWDWVGQKYVEAMRDRLLGPIMRANQIGHWLAASELEMPVSQADWMKLSEPWAKVYANEVATQSWDQTAEAVQQSVVHYVNSGLRGPALGDRLKDIFGLDPRSAKTWIAYSSRKDRPTTVPLTDKAAMLVAQRGKTIGDVQTFTAINFGRQLMYLQAIQDGKLPKDARKVWVTALDERVCEICRPMDGRAVSIIEGFQIVLPKPKTGRGKVRKSLDILVPPVHPNCRCTTVPEAIYRQGLITRRARFADSGSPAHRSRLRSDWRDLIEEVSVGKRLPWQEDKHPRDHGKFAHTAGGTVATIGGAALAVGAAKFGPRYLTHIVPDAYLASAVNLSRPMTHMSGAWLQMKGGVKVAELFGSVPKGTAPKNPYRFADTLDADFHPGDQLFYRPQAYKHLQGKSYEETRERIERFLQPQEVEHTFLVTPSGKIISGSRGDNMQAPLFVPSSFARRGNNLLTMMHNHPSPEIDASLSAQDAVMFSHYGIGRLRAITRNGATYELGLRDVPKDQAAAFTQRAATAALDGHDEAVTAKLLAEGHNEDDIMDAQIAMSEEQQFRQNPAMFREMYGEDYAPDISDEQRHLIGRWQTHSIAHQSERTNRFYQEEAGAARSPVTHYHSTQPVEKKFWDPNKHKRDDKGKFAVQAGAALTVTALVAGGSMLAFHGSQLTFEGAKGVANFDDLNGLVKYHKIKSSFGICKGLNRPKTAQYEFIHPDVWANLSGKTHDETINNLMKVTRGREVEHGFFINPDGKILAGFRGDADSVSTIMPEGISAEERSTLTFFHNHPKQFPTEQHSPLSDADLKVFGRVGLNRMIAADDRGHVYEVRAGGKWQFYQHWLAGATSGTQNATMHAVNQFGGKAEAQQRSMHQEMLVRRYLLGQKYGYTPAGQPYVSKAFSPAQARNALGEFARMRGTQTAAAGGGGALLGAEAYSLTQQRHRTAQGQRASQVRARAYPKIKGISDASFGTPITKDTHPEGTYHLSTDQLLAYRSKPSLHTPTNQQDLKNKIARYGFNRPVHMKVYDNGAELWDGNHRLNIADDLDLKTVPVKVEHYDGTRPKEATVLELMNRFKQERYRKYLARERQARSGKAD